MTAALEYADVGVRVFPCDGKVPAITGGNGCHDATTEPDVIRSWWKDLPNANIGVHAGGSGLVVLDPDGPEGRDAFARLGDEHEPWPETFVVTTPGRGGGEHWWYRMPKGLHVGCRNLADAVNAKGWGGYVLAPPSIHPTAGTPYTVRSGSLVTSGSLLHLPELPDWAAARLASAARSKGPPPAPLPLKDALGTKYGRAALDGWRAELAATPEGSRHGRLVAAAVRLQKLVLGGELPADVLGELVTMGHNIGISQQEVAPIVAWARAEVTDPASAPRERLPIVASTAVAASSLGPDALAETIEHARSFLDIPDPSALVAACAVAATRHLDEEPVWLLVVGAPSSGKTEIVRALDSVVDGRLDDVTAAGLLSWKAGKESRPVGVLVRSPSRALVTFGDLSSLLASSDRGGRDQTFAALRKVYDGHFVRDLGNAPEPLHWEGRLTVVGAVTNVIDRYAAHADALGPRWVYIRVPVRDLQGRRRAALAARVPGLEKARDRLKELAGELVTIGQQRINSVTLDDAISGAIEDAALVTCWGRAAVPRHGYGRREIDGLPAVEEPPRLIRQLRGLARGALAIGVSEVAAATLVRRVALDSMPAARRATLSALAGGETLSTAEIGRRSGTHRHVARRQLEELEAVGVVLGVRNGTEPAGDDPDRRLVTWRMAAADVGQLVAGVFSTEAPVVARKVGT